MQDTLRLFVALPLADALVARLAAAQDRLRKRTAAGSVRWVQPSRMHLTLRFLGEVAAARLDGLRRSLAAACAGRAAPGLRIEGLGAFPDVRRPRVIWAGVSGDLGTLRTLQTAVYAACDKFVPAEPRRGFEAHLTLGRVNVREPRNVRAAGEALTGFRLTDCGDWSPTEVRLVRSDRQPGGPVYTDLEVFPLVGGREAGSVAPAARS